MKKINLVSIKLTNFKGIAHTEAQFNGVTHVKGDNATGKSTLFNAFLWLLFGKDALDRKDFEIKTIGLTKAEHEVQAELIVDGIKATLRRVYKEKWTKRRGSESEEFTGHETLFFVNDVPYSAAEFQKYVGEIVSEERFKLITNPQYFNALSKEKKREMLISLAGKISDDEVVGNDNEMKGLIHLMLTSQKNADMLKKEYAAKKKRIVEELNQVPAKMEEVQRMVPVLPELQENATELLNELTDKIMQEHDATKKLESGNADQLDKMNKIYAEMREIEMGIISENNRMRNDYLTNDSKSFLEINTLENAIAGDQLRINQLRSQRNANETELDSLRERYAAIASSAFIVDKNNLVCPTCQQAIPDAEKRVLDMRNQFNTTKGSNLNEINTRGLQLKEQQQIIDNSITELQSAILTKTKELAELKAANENKPVTYLSPEALSETVKSALVEKQKEVEEINKLIVIDSDAERTARIKVLEKQREEVLEAMTKHSETAKLIESLDKRLEELKKIQKALSIELAGIEREEMVIERFKRRHDEILEERINKMFDIVKFRLFKPQINGGIEEVCDALINDVPYHSANNAAQINAGIDICNVFARRVGVTAPVWVDNAEAVNEIHKSAGQMVLLSVTKDKTLTIQ